MTPRLSLFLGVALAIAACGDDDAPTGNLAYFDLSGDLTQSSRYFDFPYPSDLRLKADGTPDLASFPNPKQIKLVDDLISVAGERPGWPTMPVAYFRFHEELAPRTQESATDTVWIIDLETRERIPTVARTLIFDDYIQGWGLAASPVPGWVLHPDRTHAVVVLRDYADANGDPLGVAPEVAALAAGKTPKGAWGEAARALYEPLWPVLDELGLARDQVATATVFTTGDVVAETEQLADALAAKHTVEIEGLALDPDDGVDHDRFCELLGTVSYPQFQRGEPPFNEEGRFEYGDDGLPIVQRYESAPVVIIIPRTAMPASGYPLLQYFHGSGGTHNEVVDRGPNRAKGEGPGYTYASFGIASAGSALPINPERAPGASAYDYINFQNLAALPYLFRQGVIEQRMFLDALLELEIAPSALAGCDGPTLPAGATTFSFDAGAVVAQGQSMGGMYTNMIGATDSRIRAVVPTGAGGHWAYFILDTDLLEGSVDLMSIILGTPFEELTMLQPGMQLITLAYEPADPFVYMPRLARRRLPGHPVRPVYEPVGEDDVYFRTELYDAAALSYGHHQAGEQVWPTMQPHLAYAGLDGIVPYPVEDNAVTEDGEPYTGVVVQYSEEGISDGHYIYFELLNVRDQASCFFATFLYTGKATVPAPGACPL